MKFDKEHEYSFKINNLPYIQEKNLCVCDKDKNSDRAASVFLEKNYEVSKLYVF